MPIDPVGETLERGRHGSPRQRLRSIQARTILLEPLEKICDLCGGTLWRTTAQDQEVYDLSGPLLVLSKPRYCHDSSCRAYLKQLRPDAQRRRLVLSYRSYTLGVLAKLGALAYRQQCSSTEISQIMTANGVPMCHQTAAYLLHLYDELVADDDATRAQRLATLRKAPATGVVLSFDGLQPDAEYPGLWLVRVPDLDRARGSQRLRCGNRRRGLDRLELERGCFLRAWSRGGRWRRCERRPRRSSTRTSRGSFTGTSSRTT